MKRVALMSMPFAAVDYPSLALGLFKSRLQAEGIPVRTFNLNIDFARMIGAETYTSFVVRPPAHFAAEQIFAEACFGSAVPSDTEFWQHNRLPAETRAMMAAVKLQVEPFLAHLMDQVPWADFDIIGFTSLFEQNLASLALARRIKSRFPHKTIVVGGPNFEDVMGQTLHRLLPFIDYVCSGEADDTFPELIKRLTYGHPVHDLPGIVWRSRGITKATKPAAMITKMNDLPVPDFSEYFAQIRALELPEGAVPSVLLETARGCWWGEKNHCTFCGLNAQSMTYRSKDAARAVDEIAILKERHGVGFVRVVDNILNNGFFEDFLPMLAERRLGVTTFFEVKANLRKAHVKALRDAGVTIVQAGIESLSTPVLKLMKKGSNALMNIQTLRWCRYYGVTCDWNLIYGFPGEKPEHYAHSVGLAKMMSHLDPPTGCGPIRLDRFSPNYNNAAEMGFKNVRAMAGYRFLYPFGQKDLDRVAYYFDFDYSEPIDDGGHLAALHAAVAHWKQRSDALWAVEAAGGVVINDARAGAQMRRLELNGLERLVFEACDAITTPNRIAQIVGQADQTGERNVIEVLNWLCKLRLVAEEGGRYIALPVMTYDPSVSVAADSPPRHGAYALRALPERATTAA